MMISSSGVCAIRAHIDLPIFGSARLERGHRRRFQRRRGGQLVGGREYETVTESWDGGDEAWSTPIVLQLGSQVADMSVNDVAVGDEVVPP